jgi:hypothetical protein
VGRLCRAAAGLSVFALLGAAASAATLPPAPPATALLLTPSAFGPRAVASDTTFTRPGSQLVIRLFTNARLGGEPVIGVVEAILERDENAASSDFAVMRTELGLNVEKNALARIFTTEFAKGAKLGSNGKAKLTVKTTVLGRPVDVGSSAFRVPMTFVTTVRRLRVALGFTHADRAIGVVFMIPLGKAPVAAGKEDAIIRAEQQQLRDAFTVANSSPPTIVGSAQQGQTLTVNAGAWTGAPSSFAYAWSRCDATGNACVPIDGATSSRYVVAGADAGSTLRVAVTGANSVSSAQATSPPTVAVM